MIIGYFTLEYLVTTKWISKLTLTELAVRCRVQRRAVIHFLVRGPARTTPTRFRDDRILKDQPLASFHRRPNEFLMDLEYLPGIGKTRKVFPDGLATPLSDPMDRAALSTNSKHNLAHLGPCFCKVEDFLISGQLGARTKFSQFKCFAHTAQRMRQGHVTLWSDKRELHREMMQLLEPGSV